MRVLRAIANTSDRCLCCVLAAMLLLCIIEPIASAQTVDASNPLASALDMLRGHVLGTHPLTPEQIAAQKLVVDREAQSFGRNETNIKSAFAFLAAYDRTPGNGPLWVSHAGFNRGKPGKLTDPPADIHWAAFTVMQNMVDHAYTVENVRHFRSLFEGFQFGSAANFPGAVAPPTDAAAPYTVTINASCPKPFKHEVMWQDVPARRPTGAYLAPGSIARVRVPAALVGKGFGIRVGAHTSDFSNRPRVVRLYRTSIVYPIVQEETLIASPLGGGIYIDVPLDASAGLAQITVYNAVRSPFYSATAHHKTSLSAWRSAERQQPGPWADFQSDSFMMQVPSSWIRNLDDPETLMKNWDKAMVAISGLMGLPSKWGKEVMYLQVDLQNRNSVLSPGYPAVNDHYSPEKAPNLNSYLIKGPQFAPDFVFHEQGHGFFFVKFDGEQESTVNLLHVAVCNQQFGFPLEDAFAASLGLQGNRYKTLDNTAVEWMTSLSFAAHRPMAAGEKAYQLKGHAKFVDIVRLFGWAPLQSFWHEVNEAENLNGKASKKPAATNDLISFNLSQAAGADLTPLLMFWGTPPKDAAALQAKVSASGIKPSARVYDELQHFLTLIPKDNAAFRQFALNWWGKQPSEKGFWTEREHAKQWDSYNEATAEAIKQTLQEILKNYFPMGRP